MPSKKPQISVKPPSYYEKTMKVLEERKKAKPLKTFIKTIVDTQNRLNYQYDHDKIRDYLSNRSILPASTIEALENRKKFLEGLGIGNEKPVRPF